MSIVRVVLYTRSCRHIRLFVYSTSPPFTPLHALSLTHTHTLTHTHSLFTGKCNLDLVEVMACPSGCNNGGGQIKTTSKGSQRELPSQGRERVQQLEDLFHEHTNVRGEPTGGGSVVRCPDESPLVQRVYGNSSSSSSSSGNSENFLLSEQQRAMLLHTRYHAVPKLDSIAPLAAKW